MGKLEYQEYVRQLESVVRVDEELGRRVQKAARDRDLSLKTLSLPVDTCGASMQQAECRAEQVLAEAITALEYVDIVGLLPKKVRPTPLKVLAVRTVKECEEVMWRELERLNSLARELHETRSTKPADRGTPDPLRVKKKRIAWPQWTVAVILGLVIIIAVLLVVL